MRQTGLAALAVAVPPELDVPCALLCCSSDGRNGGSVVTAPAQFIRNVMPLAGRPSRHGAPEPSMPASPLPRTTLPQRAVSSDLWAVPQTEKSSAHATKRSPAPLPQVAPAITL